MARNYPVPSAGPLDSTTGAQRDGIIFPAASRGVAAYNSPEFVNLNANGLRLFINITDVGAAGTLTVKIQNFDPASQSWVDVPLSTTTALAAVAITTLTIIPGAAESANVDIGDPLGLRWRVVATVAANAVNFSVGGDYLGL
jgi:hypothetical protein